jgi:hypothetical protein
MWNKIVVNNTKRFLQNLYSFSQQKPNRDLYGKILY